MKKLLIIATLILGSLAFAEEYTFADYESDFWYDPAWAAQFQTEEYPTEEGWIAAMNACCCRPFEEAE